MMLWVFSVNPSCGFYERMGGKKLRTRVTERGGATTEHTAYGWDDLSSLLIPVS